MSRRLGDDPLTRARSARAKAVEGSTPVAPDPGGQQGAAQVGIRTASRASYNDVFFQRRREGAAPPQVTAGTREAPETAEISEISEIPEIREAAAASGNQSAFDVTDDFKIASEVAQDTQVAPAPPVLIIEESTAKSNAEVDVAASTVKASPELKADPSSLGASSQASSSGGDVSKPVPQKNGGFFKRLFGKFK